MNKQVKSNQRVTEYGEVFTSPETVNDMLDLVKQETERIDSRFLEPACGNGNFLIEILRRKLNMVENTYRRSQLDFERYLVRAVSSIYGIDILEDNVIACRKRLFTLVDECYTSLFANNAKEACRRSLYYILQKNIIWGDTLDLKTVDEESKAIVFSEWSLVNGSQLKRRDFSFKELIEQSSMRDLPLFFDVIVGNPPYQLGSDGGTRYIPIYNKFVDQAKKLNPRFLSMIIPSRWMASGLWLTEFRRTMLEDRRIRKLVDFPAAGDVFPGVEVKGGVCYFLWERDVEGDCAVTTIRGDDIVGPVDRNLGEYDIFVRDSRAIDILHKVLRMEEPSIIEILSVDTEFGWTSNFDGFHDDKMPDDVAIYYIRKRKRSSGWIERSAIDKSTELIDTWKVMITKAYGAGDGIPHQILGQPFVAPSPSVCTQSYLFFYVDSKGAADSIESYIRTRFLRFLVSLRKITQDATRSTYTWVPQQSWDRIWTDDELYRKYDLTKDEIAFVESRIRPMNTGQ